MISPTSAKLIPVKDVPNFIQKYTGRKPSLASIYRWIAKGISDVRLETILVGGTPFTTEDALDEFFQKSTLAKQQRNTRNENQQPKTTDKLDSEAKELGI